MDVSICVATYGEQSWSELAKTRAIPSADAQGVPVIHRHADTLAIARNACLSKVKTGFVIHLDADDELEPGYVEAMETAEADIRAPAVRYVKPNGIERAPYIPRVAGHHHDCIADCLRDGNWLIVGSAVRTELVRKVGGWKDWPCYEDWDLFQRCWLAGASIQAVPEAVYRAHVRPDSRNRGPAMIEKNRVHHEIAAANGLKAA